MTAREAHGSAHGAPSGRGPREDRPAEAPFGDPAGEPVPAVDPELEEDLGPEFALRGDQLEAELEQAQAEAAEWRDKALRAQADFENARKRLEIRHADALLRTGERIVAELLPVIDDLERGVDHVAEQSPELAEGMVAVQRKLLGVLAKEGVAQIDPLGAPFDADKHHAVQMQPDAEVPDHTVVAVFQKGYEMHGRVLRPAMVVVSTTEL